MRELLPRDLLVDARDVHDRARAPRRRMVRAASRAHRNAPGQVHVDAPSAISAACRGAEGASRPALLTSRSSPPNASRGLARKPRARRPPRHVHRTAIARPPACAMSRDHRLGRVRLADVVDRDGRTVGGELEATPWPMPESPPVTSARRPSRRRAPLGRIEKGESSRPSPYPDTVGAKNAQDRSTTQPGSAIGAGSGTPRDRARARLAVPADRRLRVPVGLPHRRARRLRRLDRVDVPAALRLAERVRRAARPRRRQLARRAVRACTCPPGRRYIPGTNMIETTWMTPQGWLRVRRRAHDRRLARQQARLEPHAPADRLRRRPPAGAHDRVHPGRGAGRDRVRADARLRRHAGRVERVPTGEDGVVRDATRATT